MITNCVRIAVLALMAAIAAPAQTRMTEIEAARDKMVLRLQPETVSRFEYSLLQVKQPGSPPSRKP